MTHYRQCWNCGKTIASDRSDQYYCDDRCRSAYDKLFRYQDDQQRKQHVHAEKEREHEYKCEWCGDTFSVNDYAKRKGQRTPKYCPDWTKKYCRQKAFRAAGKARPSWERPDPEQGREREQRQRDQERGRQEREKYEREQNERREREQRQQRQQRTNSDDRSRADSQARFRWWETLGCKRDDAWEAFKRAYRAKAKQYHPDVNKEPDAAETMKRINLAYEECKRHFGK